MYRCVNLMYTLIVFHNSPLIAQTARSKLAATYSLGSTGLDPFRKILSQSTFVLIIVKVHSHEISSVCASVRCELISASERVWFEFFIMLRQNREIADFMT